VNSGGACGGDRYCDGAMLEFVIGRMLVYDGRKWLKRDDRRGPMRVEEDARMKRMQVKRARERKAVRRREDEASVAGSARTCVQ